MLQKVNLNRQCSLKSWTLYIKKTDNNSKPQKPMEKNALRTLGQRDFSAQETMHLLLSLK